MRNWLLLRRFSTVLTVAVLLSAGSGCTYAKYRLGDALDCVDIGLTVSTKPCWGAYGCAVGVGAIGYSDVKGLFFGIGGGQIGMIAHHENCWGIVGIGHETHAWGDYDLEDPETLHEQYVGVAGLVLFPFVESRPSYYPTCTHYLHLGHAGFVGNLRYTEMLDFICGFTTFDLSGDDGKPMARWPWKPDWEGWPSFPDEEL